MKPMKDTITRLRIARRVAFGSLTAAAQKTGVCRSSMQRAEDGLSVGPRMRRQIEATFGANLEDLQKAFLANVSGSDRIARACIAIDEIAEGAS